MAVFQEHMFVKRIEHRAFDRLIKPPDRALYTGIYRCESCGYEDIIWQGTELPDDNHTHSIDRRDRPIVWRLIVAASDQMR
jgi:hypothetical protein